MPVFYSHDEREAFWIRVYEDGGADFVSLVQSWPEPQQQRLLATYRQQREEQLKKGRQQ